MGYMYLSVRKRLGKNRYSDVFLVFLEQKYIPTMQLWVERKWGVKPVSVFSQLSPTQIEE